MQEFMVYSPVQAAVGKPAAASMAGLDANPDAAWAVNGEMIPGTPRFNNVW